MNICVLDGFALNPGDLSWEPIENMGNLSIFDRTEPDDIVERAGDAEVLLVNKVKIEQRHFDALPRLRLVCLLATGYDNVDIEAAAARKIPVCNAVGYGTESVAQHTIAMMLAFTNRVEAHNRSVQRGDWSVQEDFAYSVNTITELKGKVLGVLGYGKIGQRVAGLARAFGMRVLVVSRSGPKPGVDVVPFSTMMKESHYVSLHVPLTPNTREIINAESLGLMRSDAVLINTGRGALINEKDLRQFIVNGKIKGAILDVLSHEPPYAAHPLFSLPQVMLTPHTAWRSLEARRQLIATVAQNIKRWSDGCPQNVVN